MFKTKLLLCLCLVSTVLWGAASTRAGVPQYTITDLGSLGGASVARSVNDLGQVVGTYEPGLGKTGAFLWTPQGGLIDLPGLDGDNTYAYDINNDGQIVGGAEALGANLHAMLWDLAGNLTDINPGPNYYSVAYSINNSGRAALQAGFIGGDADYGTRLVVWKAATGFSDRGTLEGTNAIAWDINASDDVALLWDARGLRWDIVGTDAPAFSWSPTYGLQFIPPLDGSRSGNSYSLNDRWEVVGAFAIPESGANVWHAFVFVPWYPYGGSVRPYIGRGETCDLGTLGGDSIAWAISNTGEIVGTSSLADGELHAFVVTFESQYDYFHGTMRDLNDLLVDNPGWVLNEAYDINEAGQIVGYGLNPEGETHAFLLTPVPEPASLVLLLAGAALFRRSSRQ